jgi:hypothetical protein
VSNQVEIFYSSSRNSKETGELNQAFRRNFAREAEFLFYLSSDSSDGNNEKDKEKFQRKILMETGFIPDDRRRDPGNEVEPALGHASVSIFIIYLFFIYFIYSYLFCA